MSTVVTPNQLLAPEQTPAPLAMPREKRGRLARLAQRVYSLADWCLGAATLWLGLAVLASIPLGQFLALGYLLEASGRVARTGRLRDGFIGVRTAARFGRVALLGFLLWLPLYGMSILVEAARIIDPEGRAAQRWQIGLSALTLLFALHISAALLRGARVRDFLRPLNVVWLVRRGFRSGLYSEARDRLWERVVSLRLPYYFWLGVRGFLGAFLWLIVPLVLLAQGHRSLALGILGGVLLFAVVPLVAVLQTRFARDNRLRAFREVRAVRAAFRTAPLAMTLALGVHLVFSIPLYVLKIEVIPRDLVFLEGLVFLLFIFPARLLDGWAYARSARWAEPRHWTARWFGCVILVPVVAAYVLVVFTSPHLGWHGLASLYEQHAFLLPVPFVTWNR